MMFHSVPNIIDIDGFLAKLQLTWNTKEHQNNIGENHGTKLQSSSKTEPRKKILAC